MTAGCANARCAPAAIPMRGSIIAPTMHASPASAATSATASASPSEPVLASLMFSMSAAPASTIRRASSAPHTDSSAMIGTGEAARTRAMPARSSRATGCSTRSIGSPSAAKLSSTRTACSGVHPWLASMRRRTPGAASATAASRSRSASGSRPSLILRIEYPSATACRARCAIVAGSSRETVMSEASAASRSRRTPRSAPSSSTSGTPRERASASCTATSTAERALEVCAVRAAPAPPLRAAPVPPVPPSTACRAREASSSGVPSASVSAAAIGPFTAARIVSALSPVTATVSAADP